MLHIRFKILAMFLILLTLTAAVAAGDESSRSYSTTQSRLKSQRVAKNFVLQSPTFSFDGIRRTLKLVETTRLRCPDCWMTTFEFDCRNAGYGDRTGEIVMPVITHHTARITTEKFKVTEARMDDKWDMLKQEFYGQEAENPQDPVTPPTADEINTQVEGNTAFALDLYQPLASKKGNLFYSPYSISVALAMAYAGARSATAQQMAATMHFELSQAKLHPAFKSLSDELASRNHPEAEADQGRGFKLNIANAAWGQDGYPFLDSYLDILSEDYGGGFNVVDFAGATETARSTINNWVADRTEDRIPELIAEGILTSATTLVLTNAVYFNAAWQHPFSEGSTRPGAFYPEGEQSVTIDMMHLTKSFGYAEEAGYQAVALPYQREELSMLILVPEKGTFNTFEKGLTADRLARIIAVMRQQEVELTIPKFTFESEFELSDPLAEMGMTDAFSPGSADFSGIDGSRDLFISNVIHKAFVAVDEEGTEAAAATAVVFDRTSIPQSVKMTVDRPFIFLIRDHRTDSILFIGRVMNPAG